MEKLVLTYDHPIISIPMTLHPSRRRRIKDFADISFEYDEFAANLELQESDKLDQLNNELELWCNRVSKLNSSEKDVKTISIIQSTELVTELINDIAKTYSYTRLNPFISSNSLMWKQCKLIEIEAILKNTYPSVQRVETKDELNLEDFLLECLRLQNEDPELFDNMVLSKISIAEKELDSAAQIVNFLDEIGVLEKLESKSEFKNNKTKLAEYIRKLNNSHTTEAYRRALTRRESKAWKMKLNK